MWVLKQKCLYTSDDGSLTHFFITFTRQQEFRIKSSLDENGWEKDPMNDVNDAFVEK